MAKALSKNERLVLVAANSRKPLKLAKLVERSGLKEKAVLKAVSDLSVNRDFGFPLIDDSPSEPQTYITSPIGASLAVNMVAHARNAASFPV